MFIDLEITVTSGAPENTKAGVFLLTMKIKGCQCSFCGRNSESGLVSRYCDKVIIDLILPLFCTKEYYSAIELLTVSVEQNENLPFTRGF